MIGFSPPQFHPFLKLVALVQFTTVCLLPPTEPLLLSSTTWRDQQCGHHLGACWKYRISGPITDLTNQNLHFNWIPRWLACTLQIGKRWSQTFIYRHA